MASETGTEEFANPDAFTPAGVFGFDLFDPQFRTDPYPAYRRMLEEHPVRRSSLGLWAFFRYADCNSLLHDPRTSSDQRNSEIFQALADEDFKQQMEDRTRPFLFLDPPDHTRLRGLVSKAFTPRRLEALRPRIQELVDGMLAPALDGGSMEVIEELAYPLPVQIICEMLGVPPEDHDTFKGWSRELARSLDPDFALPQDVIARRENAATAFAEYFQNLIEERRKHPAEDLLSGLLAARDAGDRLSDEELLATGILLLIAGHETTVSLIGNGLLAFIRNPGEFDRLREQPDLSKNAVEEVLRFDPPVQMTGRIAKEDIELDSGTFTKGAQGILFLGSANRDPAHFEDPDSFDITRKANHLAFSAGIHFCLGAPLARLEAQVVFRTLAEGTKSLNAIAKPAYKENIVLRGLEELRVEFET